MDSVFTLTQQNDVLPSQAGSGSGTEACPTKQELNGHNRDPPLFLPGDDENEISAPDTADIGRVEASGHQ